MKTALKPYRECLSEPAGAFTLSAPPGVGRPLGFYGYAPSTLTANSDILVCVHGINRNAASQLFRFRRLAEDAGALLIAPIFARKQFRRYQTLQPSKCGRRPDVELIRLIDEMTNTFGLNSPALRMFGYSGGGQFVNRFVLRHAARVHSAVLAAPGWYTLPDPTLAYPVGVGAAPEQEETHLKAFLAADISVIVGARDTVRDKSLNQAPAIDETQGQTRVERARTFCASVRREASARGIAPSILMHTLANGIHSFEQNMDRCGLEAVVRARLFPKLNDRHGAMADRTLCA